MPKNEAFPTDVEIVFWTGTSLLEVQKSFESFRAQDRSLEILDIQFQTAGDKYHIEFSLMLVYRRK